MCDPKIDAARLLDYLDPLDRWAHQYAWPLCQVTP